MAKLHKWQCPSCTDTVRAPSKPRADDTRRLCLPCSAKTGRFVRRLCAVLEQARQERQTKRQAANQAKRERNRVRRVETAKEQASKMCPMVCGPLASKVQFDVMAEAKRYWAVLMANPLLASECTKGLPTIRLSACAGAGASGRGGQWRVRVRLGRGADLATARTILLHELCHSACPPGTVHGKLWRMVYRDAALTLWGVEVTIPDHRYAQDDLLEAELRAKLGLPHQHPHWLAGAKSPRDKRIYANFQQKYVLNGDLATREAAFNASKEAAA